MPYVRSLDGLRAVAILLVMAVHYHFMLPGGWVGVQLFFVLSGFLITQILLDARSDAPGRSRAEAPASTPMGLGARWLAFLSRRVRRIAPLYLTYTLLLLSATFLFDAPAAWSRAMPWLLTYTVNFAYVLGRLPLDDMFAHFWSLGIEMQVYLLWPVLVWTLSRAALRRAILMILVLAPLCRWFLAEHGYGPFELYFLTPCQLDAFAAGAAVAIFEREPELAFGGWLRGLRHSSWVLACLAFAIVITLALGVSANWSAGGKFALMTGGYPYFMPLNGQYIWGYTLLDLTAALAVLACLRGKLRLLEAPWLVMTGRISYGLYIFHRPLLGLLDTYVAPSLQSIPWPALSRPLLGLAYVVGSFALAFASYHLLEVRFLGRGVRTRSPLRSPARSLGSRVAQDSLVDREREPVSHQAPSARGAQV